MAATVGLGFAPDPEDPLDVLAFILCPATAFAPAGDAAELAAVRELLRPIKDEAVRRWADLAARRRRS
jgi:hypothetical protein